MSDTPPEVAVEPPIEEPEPLAIKPKKSGLTKYTIYTTSKRMYVVGSNTRETLFRILEIDLTSPTKLVIMEDNVYFSRTEIIDVLNGLEESSEGGLTKKVTAVGLLGFIRFTKYYYLLVVTKRRPVATIGGYYMYHIDGTELIPVTNSLKKEARNTEEARFMQTFTSIDLTKTFYYSYTYDLTNTLQTNMLRYKTKSLGLVDDDLAHSFAYNDRFVWNSHLLEPVLATFDRAYDWFLPIIHGFIDQIKICIFDADVYVTLIARRSHYFAGARFFKRGVNDRGNVANEVETEQIVADMLTTSFNDPEAGFYNNERFTSFVQHRGSIPLSWSQATAPNIRMTKPPIELNVIDPYYSSAALHFDNLFKRYGSPVQVLNLIKQKEKTPRETKLLTEFEDCINYLNEFLPKDKQIQYTGWDMSRASKSHGQDVIAWLENYSEKTLRSTNFFHNGKTIEETQLQEGVCRTNCIDCLDRTNTAQFVIGKRALGHQLAALGFIEGRYLEYDSDAINTLTEMFHDHGDTIALQYGGSHLVNTLQTYRKINQWSSHSRDMIESVKRFYSNSFVDAQRQDAINLFLGNYVYSEGHPMLWDLNTDYYLHNNFDSVNLNYRPSYTHWYSDCNLEGQKKKLMELQKTKKSKEFNNAIELAPIKIEPIPGIYDNYWNNKYPPRELTSFSDLFEFNMNSTLQFSGAESKLPTTSASSTIDVESTHNAVDVSQLNHVTDGSKYISPFKSRKPHRELRFLEYNLEENNHDSNSDSESSDEQMEYTSLSEIQFSLHQYNRLKENQRQMCKVLENNNIGIKDSLKNSKTLPVITSVEEPSGSHVFDFVDETYVDDWESHGSSFVNSETSEEKEQIFDRAKDEHYDKMPTVAKADVELYTEIANKGSSKHILGLPTEDPKINGLYEEYVHLVSPSIDSEDLNSYSHFVQCLNAWKLDPFEESSPNVEVIQKPVVDGPDAEESFEVEPKMSIVDEDSRDTGYVPNKLSVVHEGDHDYFSFGQELKAGLEVKDEQDLEVLDVQTDDEDDTVGGLKNEDILNSPFSHKTENVIPPTERAGSPDSLVDTVSE